MDEDTEAMFAEAKLLGKKWNTLKRCINGEVDSNSDDVAELVEDCMTIWNFLTSRQW